MSSLGKMHESRPNCRRSGKSISRNICRNRQFFHRTNQLQNDGAFLIFISDRKIFCLLAVFGSVFLSNFAFGLLRHRDPPQRYLQYQQPPPPQTPVQMPNLVMMSPWNGNTRMGSPQRMGSPRRKTSQRRNSDGE
jgi:hypothetical protein